jgi:hypothetical protein
MDMKLELVPVPVTDVDPDGNTWSVQQIVSET